MRGYLEMARRIERGKYGYQRGNRDKSEAGEEIKGDERELRTYFNGKQGDFESEREMGLGKGEEKGKEQECEQ